MLNTLAYVFAELLYQRTSNKGINLTASELLILRSTWAVFILLCLMNVNMKGILYDGVAKGDVFPIAFRSIQGTISNLINFAAAKYIQIAVVGVVNQLSPVCCVLLCYVLLGETLAIKEIIFLFLIVVCIFDIVIFAPKGSQQETKSIT